MKKIIYILKEMFQLIRKHKLYFLAPLALTIVLITILFIKFGPSVILAFIYAGV